jgi:hypothetical protein
MGISRWNALFAPMSLHCSLATTADSAAGIIFPQSAGNHVIDKANTALLRRRLQMSDYLAIVR